MINIFAFLYHSFSLDFRFPWLHKWRNFRKFGKWLCTVSTPGIDLRSHYGCAWLLATLVHNKYRSIDFGPRGFAPEVILIGQFIRWKVAWDIGHRTRRQYKLIVKILPEFSKSHYRSVINDRMSTATKTHWKKLALLLKNTDDTRPNFNSTRWVPVYL